MMKSFDKRLQRPKNKENTVILAHRKGKKNQTKFINIPNQHLRSTFIKKITWKIKQAKKQKNLKYYREH